MSAEEVSAVRALRDVLRDPVQYLFTNWNWKSSLLSAACRGVLFFGLSAPAGWTWATRALLTEVAFRAVASGVLGSLTQALRHTRPRIVALILLPALGHLGEFIVHLSAGTPRLSASITASIAFTVVTTAFTMFAMRRGVLIVGRGQQSLASDLATMPAMVVAFVAATAAALLSVFRSRRFEDCDQETCSSRRSI